MEISSHNCAQTAVTGPISNAIHLILNTLFSEMNSTQTPSAEFFSQLEICTPRATPKPLLPEDDYETSDCNEKTDWSEPKISEFENEELDQFLNECTSKDETQVAGDKYSLNWNNKLLKLLENETVLSKVNSLQKSKYLS